MPQISSLVPSFPPSRRALATSPREIALSPPPTPATLRRAAPLVDAALRCRLLRLHKDKCYLGRRLPCAEDRRKPLTQTNPSAAASRRPPAVTHRCSRHSEPLPSPSPSSQRRGEARLPLRCRGPSPESRRLRRPELAALWSSPPVSPFAMCHRVSSGKDRLGPFFLPVPSVSAGAPPFAGDPRFLSRPASIPHGFHVVAKLPPPQRHVIILSTWEPI
ncbi:hypothetical protein DAI22_08g136350 [Oryza sativa Japonica Group]|nr:hypothetical protein DAI22_08g136350 [Oryza sativa Japonica Group]